MPFDPADYVPRELLAEWEQRDPVRGYGERLLATGVADQVELEEIQERCTIEITDAINAFAEASPFPDGATVEEESMRHRVKLHRSHSKSQPSAVTLVLRPPNSSKIAAASSPILR